MIECQNISKKFKTYIKEPGLSGSIKSFFKREYKNNYAVNDVSFKINKGEFVGLLGPNGAGKTTLMKMMTGIIVPSDGTLNVAGHQPFQREIPFRKKIALVMGQKSQLWWDIPAEDSFLLLQKYYQVPNKQFTERLNYLSNLLDVERLLKIHVRKLSLGERMKMELIASILHNPEVIFLDEPTIGLDLSAQNKIREFITQYQKESNATVILTSHYMTDIAALCKRIIFINHGKKSFDGSVEEFEGMLGKDKFVKFEFEFPIDTELSFWKDMQCSWEDNHSSVEIRLPEKELRSKTMEILKEFPVTDFYTEQLPIERVMHSLTNNSNFAEKL